ncbi:unnamed protein product [Angiostrongylus costaricensis]|uniref:PABS domain-containing protein n=1 Tax=Angiostrongylus costaricensis TaxID=334426 RepID=A0A0R3PQH0_ANGCS|nr:unnamed protein product [Angiostrongylus costaricensis]
MIAGSFFSGALLYDSSEIQNILIIGLGGGVINNYFSTMDKLQLNVTVVDNDPVMKAIARKWYEFESTSTQRIIVDDGLRYIREGVQRGNSKYIKYLPVLILEHPVLTSCVDPSIFSIRLFALQSSFMVVV